MGFSDQWCKWIRACISGAWFSVIVNGTASGFFSSTQGIRQGDPLSPSLFIIMAEAFSRTIRHYHFLGKWKGENITGTSISITHSLFVDDTLLFGISQVSEARQVKKILKLYSDVLGQKINSNKSKIFLFFTNKVILDRIVKILGFSEDFLPSTYLGIPFYMGSNKTCY